MSLRFGPAGFGQTILDIPKNSKNPSADAIIEISKIGLSALELEFVRSVYLKKSPLEKIEEIKKNSIDKDVSLSIHAPYFINLNAKEEHKIINSHRYILDSLNIGQILNAKVVVCHIGYFLKEDPKTVLDKTSHQISLIEDKFKGDVKLGIELTGKKTQVGSIEEIFYFIDKHPNFVMPVIDFSHQHARENGFFNNKKNLKSFFEKLKSYPEILNNFHAHMSGIAYGEKGEKHHLTFREADFPYRDILKELKDNKVRGTIICESPEIVEDALFLKKVYNDL